MKAKFVFAVAAVVLLTACSPVDPDRQQYQTATLVLPEGHADQGRDVFLALGCASCHAVSWDKDIPAPIAEKPGPVFDATLSQVYAGTVATSIIVPSHTTDLSYVENAWDLSPMGDYSESMTIRQLVDVVAYLRQEGISTARNVPPMGG